MAIYIVDTTYGRTVQEGRSLRTARTEARRRHGERNFEAIKLASMDELVEIKKFGGWLPEWVRPEVEAAIAAAKPTTAARKDI